MTCPYCNKLLTSLGEFSSIPCHFSYNEEAPDILQGELFICDNVHCSHFESHFYWDSDEKTLNEGRPEGI